MSVEPEHCTYESDDPPHAAIYLLEAPDPDDPVMPQQWLLCTQHLDMMLILIGQATISLI